MPVDASLLRLVNLAAMQQDMTQRDWIIKVLVEAVNGGNTRKARAVKAVEGDGVVPTGDVEDVAAGIGLAGDLPEVGEPRNSVGKCWCGQAQYEHTNINSGVTKWRCEKGHYSSPKAEVKK